MKKLLTICIAYAIIGMSLFSVTNVGYAQKRPSGSLMKVANASSFLSDGNVISQVVDGNILYVAVATFGLFVFDIKDPKRPVQVGQPIILGIPTKGMIKVEKYLYLTDNAKGIIVVDIANPYQAKIAGTFRTSSGQAWDLKVDPKLHYLYVAAGASGVETWNIINRIRIRNVSQTKGKMVLNNAVALFAMENKIYVGDKDAGLFLLNSKDPENLVMISNYRSTNSDVIIKDIWSDGKYVYLATGRGGLEVIADNNGQLELYPAFKNESSDYTNVVTPYNKSKKVLFTGAGTKSGLIVYNVEKIEDDMQENQLITNDEITSIAQYGHILYVGTTKMGVQTFSYNLIPKPKELIKNQTVMEENVLEYQIPEVIDLDDDDRTEEVLTVDGSPLPEGAEYNPENGIFSWETDINQEGIYNFVFKIQEEGIGGVALEYPFKVTVTHKTSPPKFVLTGVTLSYKVKENNKLIIQIPEAEIEDKDRPLFKYKLITDIKNVTFDQNVRRLLWTPSYEQAGNYSLKVAVVGPDNMSDTIRYKVFVENVNRDPIFTNEFSNVKGKENEELIYPITIDDPDSEDKGKLTLTLEGQIPKGLTIVTKDSLKSFKWAPTFDQSGEYDVMLSLKDVGYDANLVKGKNVLEVKKKIHIIILQTNRKPELAEIPDQTTKENKKISFKVTARDADTEDQKELKFTAFGSPEGATFSGITQTFEWTPTYKQSGVYTVKFKVSDEVTKREDALFDEKKVTLNVENVNLPPVIGKIIPVRIEEGKQLVMDLPVSDPDIEDVGKLKLASSNLPEGAKIESMGKDKFQLKWTPDFSQSKQYTINLEAKDSAGLVAKQAFVINVLHVNRKPTFVAMDDKQGIEDKEITFQLAAKDTDEEDKILTFKAISIPDGAKFSKGLFSWKPTFEQAGNYETVFAVEDDGKDENKKPSIVKILRDTIHVKIQIRQKNRRPEFKEMVAKHSIKENEELKIILKPFDPDMEDDGKLKVQLSNMPEGMSYNEQEHLITWTPAYQQAGNYEIIAKVEDTGVGIDSLKLTKEEKIQIRVINVNRLPEITELKDSVTVNENSEIKIGFKVSDMDKEDEGKLIVKANGLPKGATFDEPNRMITWTPTYEQAGKYSIRIDVMDQGLDENIKPDKKNVKVVSKSVSIEVKQTNRKPDLAAIPDQSIDEMKKLTFKIKATDPDKEDANKLKYTNIDSLPSGSKFDASKQEFTWTPTYEQSGDYSIEFKVTDSGIDGTPLSDMKKAKITVKNVNRKPSMEKIANVSVEESKQIQVEIKAGDPDREDKGKLTIVSKGTLPAGAEMKVAEGGETATLTWTPTYEQGYKVYPFEFEVKDVEGLTASQKMSIEVLNVNRAPQITAVDVPRGKETKEIKFDIVAMDNDKEDKLTYRIDGMPKGSKLVGNKFSWTPDYTQAGSYKAKVVVTDLGLDSKLRPNKGMVLSAEKEIEIVIGQRNRKPSLIAIKAQAVKENDELVFEVKGTDPDKEDEGKLKYMISNLPEGAKFDGNKFTWKPTYEQAGEYKVEAKVEDTGLEDSVMSASQSVSIKVKNVNRLPVIDELAENVVGAENSEIKIGFKVSDLDKEDEGKLIVKANGLPKGATFDEPNRMITWTPTYEQAGKYSIRIDVMDQGLDENIKPDKKNVKVVSKSVSIEVKQTNRKPDLAAIPDQSIDEMKKLTFKIKATDPDKEDANKLKYTNIDSLPSGSKFDASKQEFTWTPTYEQSGDYSIEFKVTDSGIDGTPLSDMKKAKITVKNVNRKPSMEKIANVSVEESKQIQVEIKAGDPDREDKGKLTIVSKGTLPAGAEMKVAEGGETATLTWTPTYEQGYKVYPFEFEVKDVEGLTASQKMSIEVLNVNRAPQITAVDVPRGKETKEIKFDIVAMDNDKEDKLTYRIDGMPKGSKLVGNKFSWTPDYTQAGSYKAKVVVTDLGLDSKLRPNKGMVLSAEKEIEIVIGQRNRKPSLIAIKAQAVKENDELVFEVKGTDPDKEDEGKLKYMISNLPEGAKFDGNKFTWKPTYEQAGEYKVEAKVEDTGLEDSVMSASQSVSIKVKNVNRLPVIEELAENVVGAENSEIKIGFKVSDMDKEDEGKLIVKANGLPKGATFDEPNRMITWTPTYEQAGKYSIRIDVMDQGLDENIKPDKKNVKVVSKSVSIEVKQTNRKPDLAAIPDQSIDEMKKLTFKIKATDPDKEDANKLKYTNIDSLPSGSKFDASKQEFTWTPTYEQSGDYSIEFKVTDSGIDGTPLSDMKKAKITVKNVNRKPSMEKIANVSVEESKQIQVEIKAGDPDREDKGKLTIVSKGTLPAGAEMKVAEGGETATLTWTPTYEQGYKVYPFEFEVKDVEGLTASQKMSIEVLNVNRAPQITAVDVPRGKETKEIKFDIVAMDNDKEDKLTYRIDGMPKGSKLVGNKFSWTPDYTQAGSYKAKVVVTDLGLDSKLRPNKGMVLSAEKEIEIVIGQRNRKPSLIAIKAQAVKENDELVFEVKGTDPDKEDEGKLKYMISNLPEGAKFDGNKFTWKPTYEQAGEYKVEAKVEDTGLEDSVMSASQSVSIKVKNVNRLPVIEELAENVVGAENSEIKIGFKVSDMDKEDEGKLIVKANGLPKGATFDEPNRMITWTPTYEQAGKYSIRIDVMDQGLDENIKPDKKNVKVVSKSVSIEVKQTNRKPVFKDIPNKETSEEKTITFSVSAVDPDKEDAKKLKYGAYGLPEGAKFDDAKALFTWTPKYLKRGVYEITFNVKDEGMNGEAPLTDEKKMSITVLRISKSPKILPIAPQTVTEGETLKLKLEVEKDPDDKIEVNIIKAPMGVAFNKESYELEWTPGFDKEGNYTFEFEVKVIGGDPKKALKSSSKIAVKVLNKNTPPRFGLTQTDFQAIEGTQLSIDLKAIDDDKGDTKTLKITAENLPKGAVLKGGNLVWKPKKGDAGEYSIKVTAADKAGEKAEVSIKIAVSK